METTVNGETNPKKRERNETAKVWWGFLRDTTFHGCRNIENRERSVIVRILWTLMVLGMLGGLSATLVESYLDYIKYRTNSNSRITVKREMPFPAITVCSSSTVNVENKTMSPALRKFFAAGSLFKDLVPPINLSSPEFAELDLVTVEDVVDMYNFADVKDFIFLNTWNGEGSVEFEPVNTFIGKCYVANRDVDRIAHVTEEGKHGGLEMVINIHEAGIIMSGKADTGAIVFIHDPRENARTLKSGIAVAPGNAIYMNLKPTKYRFLPAPYKFGTGYCVNTDDAYSYEACVNDWANTQTITICNCSSVIGPPDLLAIYQRCTLRETVYCFNPTIGHFLKESLQENFTVCPKPCSFTRYDTSISTSAFPSSDVADLIASFYPNTTAADVRRNLLKVTIYFDRFFEESVVYTPDITVNSILSSLGGQMGFFLGASLLTVCELGEAILLYFLSLGKRLSRMNSTSSFSK